MKPKTRKKLNWKESNRSFKGVSIYVPKPDPRKKVIKKKVDN